MLQSYESTAADKQSVQKEYKSVTCRAKRAWMQQRNAELTHMSSKAPKACWKAYSTCKKDLCPLCPQEQTEAFKKLYGTQPPEPFQMEGTPHVPSSSSESNECMFADITADVLQDCTFKAAAWKEP